MGENGQRKRRDSLAKVCSHALNSCTMIQWEGEIKQQIQKKNIFELESIVKTQNYNNYEKAHKGQ